MNQRPGRPFPETNPEISDEEFAEQIELGRGHEALQRYAELVGEMVADDERIRIFETGLAVLDKPDVIPAVPINHHGSVVAQLVLSVSA